jgi:hypothetical protein
MAAYSISARNIFSSLESLPVVKVHERENGTEAKGHRQYLYDGIVTVIDSTRHHLSRDQPRGTGTDRYFYKLKKAHHLDKFESAGVKNTAAG